MKETAEVVVVGGGALGVLSAYHLNELGVDVLLLERDDIAQATSTCGAGFIGQWAAGWVAQWGEEELACERYGIDFFRELHQGDDSLTFHSNGTMFITTTPEGWDQFLVPLAECEAIANRRVVGSAEVASMTGVLRAAPGVRAVFHPDGVQVTARDAVRAVARRLVERGGHLEVRRPVSELTVQGGRVIGVKTPTGPVAADAVLLAAAMWTNALLDGHSWRLAYAPLGALRITTGPLGVPGTMPMLLFPEFSHAWLREEHGRMLLGCAYGGEHRNALLDSNPLPERVEQMPMDGFFETLRVAEELAKVIPILGGLKNVTMAQGAPCYTPDLRALIGPLPETGGLYVLTGDNEAGVTHAPGYGRAVAELITGRSPFVALEAFRVDRFDGRLSARDVADAISGTSEIFFQ
jgi:sarcosine oxidase, subunit beta